MKIIIIICIIIVLFYFVYKILKISKFLEYFFGDNTDYSKKLKEYIDLIDNINIKRINQIPVYYINMDKDIDRRQYMDSQLSNHFERYYRIPGVNGKLIKNKNHDIVDGIKFINEFKELSLSEIGCTLSHLLAIKTAYDNGEEIACIMEDDVYMNLLNVQDESLDDFVKEINNNLDWEILKLYHQISNNLSKNFIKIKDYILHLHQKGKYTYSTVSYIINRKGMEKILSNMGNNPFYLLKKMSVTGAADSILYDQAKTYTVNPSFIIPNNTDLDSTIHTDHTNDHLKTSFNTLKKYENRIIKKQKIPNQILFVFGFKKQTEEFLFCYYLSVYSAYIVNNPDKILFYYHYDIYGEWFDKLKEISCIEFIKIDIPTHIGKKSLKKVAHIADKIRMEKLYEHGGIYMDIDTISIRPYKHLLNNETVLGFESDNAICNAVMLTIPKSRFFKIWLSKYEKEFKSDGWGESSISLPYKIYSNNKDIVKVLPKETFFIPSYTETDKIFEKNNNIPNELITLHLWESFSIKYMENIKDWSWMYNNSHTLYGKIMLKIYKKSI
jgi:GR25 family glycosyltransferase involved in LPS biosynthesis